MNNQSSEKEIIKYDTNGKKVELSEEDKEDLIHWEAVAKEAVDEAVEELHSKAIPSVHADKKGIYEKSPEGSKKYISLKYLKDCLHGRR